MPRAGVEQPVPARNCGSPDSSTRASAPYRAKSARSTYRQQVEAWGRRSSTHSTRASRRGGLRQRSQGPSTTIWNRRPGMTDRPTDQAVSAAPGRSRSRSTTRTIQQRRPDRPAPSHGRTPRGAGRDARLPRTHRCRAHDQPGLATPTLTASRWQRPPQPATAAATTGNGSAAAAGSGRQQHPGASRSPSARLPASAGQECNASGATGHVAGHAAGPARGWTGEHQQPQTADHQQTIQPERKAGCALTAILGVAPEQYPGPGHTRATVEQTPREPSATSRRASSRQRGDVRPPRHLTCTVDKQPARTTPAPTEPAQRREGGEALDPRVQDRQQRARHPMPYASPSTAGLPVHPRKRPAPGSRT